MAERLFQGYTRGNDVATDGKASLRASLDICFERR
jgi:hypothetical protein